MIDIVIPLGIKSNWDFNEIKFCLRSFEQNFKDIGKIFIIGYLPPFLQNVYHIPCDDIFKRNKDANLIRKILLICENIYLSDNFLKVSDDYIALKPFNEKDLEEVNNNGNLQLIINKIKLTGINRWRKRLINTQEVLSKKYPNKFLYNFDTHSPHIINKLLFKKTINEYNWGIEDEGYTINTLYFNSIDCKIKNYDDKINIEKDVSKIEIEELCKNKKFLNYSDKGLNDHLKNFLIEKFPNKCRYEK